MPLAVLTDEPQRDLPGLVSRLDQRFGAPSLETAARLHDIGDTRRLERMTDRVLAAVDWADLLSTP